MRTILKKIAISIGVIAINVIVALMLIRLAYLERGYNAVGGEWILIILLAVGSVNFIIELSKAKEIEK